MTITVLGHTVAPNVVVNHVGQQTKVNVLVPRPTGPAQYSALPTVAARVMQRLSHIDICLNSQMLLAVSSTTACISTITAFLVVGPQRRPSYSL